MPADNVGTLRNNLTVTANVYRNNVKDSSDFYASSYYTSGNPPAGCSGKADRGLGNDPRPYPRLVAECR